MTHVLIAKPRGFCAGVERAVGTVQKALELNPDGKMPYVFHEIVHNQYVVNDFVEKGVRFVDQLSEVPIGELVVFSAHGVSPAVLEEANRRALLTVDATCPLVTKVHNEVIRFKRLGYHLVLVGHEGHDEVVGTTGYAPESITLVQDLEDASRVDLSAYPKLVCLTQTTLSIDETREIIATLKKRYPHLEQPPKDDICYATTNRQEAVKTLIGRGIEMLLVVGSQNSSNSLRLAEIARDHGIEGHLIDGEDNIRSEWFAGKSLIGLTAGASAPERVIRRVVDTLISEFECTTEETALVDERQHFGLPEQDLKKLSKAPINAAGAR